MGSNKGEIIGKEKSQAILRLAGLTKESVVDGPGVRLVVFAQGCPHRCTGCHNPETWPFTGGQEVAVADIIAQVAANSLLKGVTLSGGEPFAQAAAMAELARAVKELGRDVVVYSGYTYEELQVLAQKDAAVAELLANCDYLVDGRFVLEERDLTLKYRGSRNQRVIDLNRTREKGEIVTADWA